MTNQPKKKYQAGQISVTAWENEREVNGQKIPMTSFQLQKRYKDGEEWKTSNSLNLNDLPKAAMLLQKAYEETVLKSKEE